MVDLTNIVFVVVVVVVAAAAAAGKECLTQMIDNWWQ